MEKLSKPSLSKTVQIYYQLTKPGILFGNSITAIAGFLFADYAKLPLFLLTLTVLGLALIMGSGCVFNNCIDRQHDAQMKRTQNRALVKEELSVQQALLFASVLLISGSLILGFLVNILALSLALIGFFIYISYSFLKYQTTYATLIGSFAGAAPPAVGYCALAQRLDLAALLLFALLVFWQMPHFHAISIYRLEDYSKIAIPVLPVKKGILHTKIHMVLYIIGFMGIISLFTLLNYTSPLFLIIMNIISLNWLRISFLGFKAQDNKLWGKRMFKFSLIVIMAFSFLTPIFHI
ncbi:MAG: Protoheme IX farnesyltransferase [Chlamydiae bacterium]|nr:Protoheme IX farnesyltransferase [Chlamydiota bacterium]